jgi:hypothetical protein
LKNVVDADYDPEQTIEEEDCGVEALLFFLFVNSGLRN